MVHQSKTQHGESEGKSEKRQRVESLGWLTESAVMPKKQKAIEGVGASSIMGLRAELYRSQEEAKRNKDNVLHGEAPITRKRIEKNDPFSRKNPNVEQRAERDKLILQAEEDGTAVYTALERKAELYKKLVKGELSDEEEKEKYSVDFVRKGWLEEEREDMNKVEEDSVSRIWQSHDKIPSCSNSHGEAGFASHSESKSNSKSITEDIGDLFSKIIKQNLSHKDLVREVNVETKEAREKTSLVKEQRKAQAEKNREKLRMAILQKQTQQKMKMKMKKKEVGSDSVLDPKGIV